MAKITPEGLTGLIGPVVIYVKNGQQYARSRPKKHKKSKRTPNRSLFASVTKYGSPMIKEAKGMFALPFKLYTYNAMRGWMRNVLSAQGEDEALLLSDSGHGMCQLNALTDLRDVLRTDITVEDVAGKIHVSVPELNPHRHITTPPRTKFINMKVVAVTSSFNEGAQYYSAVINHRFENKDVVVPAKQFVLEPKAAIGDMAVVYLALEFEILDNGEILKDEKWLPAAAIAMGRIGG